LSKKQALPKPMNKKIRVKGQKWREHEYLCLGISLGKEAHEGANLRAALRWIANTGKPCIIDLSDTLQRHNFVADGMSEEEAFRFTRQRGDDWLERNKDSISLLPCSPIIVRWNDLLFLEEFFLVQAEFLKLAQTDQQLKSSIEEDVRSFCDRRANLSSEERARFEKCSKDFILEEMAGHTLLSRQYDYAVLYPSCGLKSLKLLREGKIDGAPMGMQRIYKARFSIETRKVTETDFGSMSLHQIPKDNWNNTCLCAA